MRLRASRGPASPAPTASCTDTPGACGFSRMAPYRTYPRAAVGYDRTAASWNRLSRITGVVGAWRFDHLPTTTLLDAVCVGPMHSQACVGRQMNRQVSVRPLSFVKNVRTNPTFFFTVHYLWPGMIFNTHRFALLHFQRSTRASSSKGTGARTWHDRNVTCAGQLSCQSWM